MNLKHKYLRGGRVEVKTMQDLLSDKIASYEKNKGISKTKPWTNYKKLYGNSIKGMYKINNEPKKRIIKKANNHIIRVFLDKVMEDIINGEEFAFPNKKIVLSIADRNRDSKRYKYNIYKRGHDYIPFLYISRKFWNKLRTHYYISFRPRWIKRLREVVNQGMEYKQSPVKTKR